MCDRPPPPPLLLTHVTIHVPAPLPRPVSPVNMIIPLSNCSQRGGGGGGGDYCGCRGRGGSLSLPLSQYGRLCVEWSRFPLYVCSCGKEEETK